MEETNNIGNPVLPDPIVFAAETIGWKVLAVSAVILLVLLTVYLVWRYRKNAYRRSALKYLGEVVSQYPDDHAKCINEASLLMKRIALREVDREEVASLQREDWVSFLNHTASKGLFSPDDGQLMDVCRYQPATEVPDVQFDQFMGKTRKWIAKHEL